MKEEKTVSVIGIGPGGKQWLTQEAEEAIRRSDLVVGYTVYVELVRAYFPEKEYLTTPMKQEAKRCEMALAEANEGKQVAMVCSGDAGVYGMAGLMLELGTSYPNVEIRICPGITAALAGGAVLGAPLTHDFAVISLSDLLTPKEKIEKRLKAAAMADFVICLYNPSSKKRKDYLAWACGCMMEYKKKETVCGIVRNIGREGQESKILTLEELQHTQVDMFSTVFVGNEETREIDGKMVTPRGYRNV